MDNKKFIITTNDESASLLIQTGFNNLSDVVYSDKLFI